MTWYYLNISIFFVCDSLLFMGRILSKASWQWAQCRGEWLTVKDAMQALYKAETSFKLSVWKAGIDRYRVK